jgi:hypothetical protein
MAFDLALFACMHLVWLSGGLSFCIDTCPRCLFGTCLCYGYSGYIFTFLV